MWERIKEIGFDLVAIGLLCSNMVTFIYMIVYGVYEIWEPWKWLLYLEAGLDFLFICWGIERLAKDMINARRKRR